MTLDKEQKSIFGNIDREASLLKERLSANKIKDDFGLCNRCNHFSQIERELETISNCNESYYQGRPIFKLDKRNKVNDCSMFEPAGVMDIRGMWSIAKLIDIEDKPIGFNLTKEVKITDTEEQDDD